MILHGGLTRNVAELSNWMSVILTQQPYSVQLWEQPSFITERLIHLKLVET
jgi:hypothetical protein